MSNSPASRPADLLNTPSLSGSLFDRFLLGRRRQLAGRNPPPPLLRGLVPGGFIGRGVVGDLLPGRGQAVQVPVGQLADRQRAVFQRLDQQLINERLLAVVVV